MFTGIVESVGVISQIKKIDECLQISIKTKQKFDDLNVGDSIAVNGVCLTITHFFEEGFQVTAVPETLRLTTLKHLTKDNSVNLERPLIFNARLGGHYVQGHIDFVGEILDLQKEGDALMLKISYPLTLAKYIVNKGCITLDGMSITVIYASDEWFMVTLIPHTREATIAKQYLKGSKINIEVDILGKYIEKLIGVH